MFLGDSHSVISNKVLKRKKHGAVGGLTSIVSIVSYLALYQVFRNRNRAAQAPTPVVRYIYSSYMNGMTIREIAESLTAAGVPTVKGNPVWSYATVRNMLQNEKYCGDVLMQKSYTVDCFSHKTVKNRGQKPQYRLTNNHPAIIPREDWMAVQAMLALPRRRGAAMQEPIEEKFRVTRIKSGRLKGFVALDPKWRTKDIDKLFDWLDEHSRKGN